MQFLKEECDNSNIRPIRDVSLLSHKVYPLKVTYIMPVTNVMTMVRNVLIALKDLKTSLDNAHLLEDLRQVLQDHCSTQNKPSRTNPWEPCRSDGHSSTDRSFRDSQWTK